MTNAVELRQGIPLLRAPAAKGVGRPDLDPGDMVHLTDQTEEFEDLSDRRNRLVTKILKADDERSVAQLWTEIKQKNSKI
jgi:hypothetical protein